MSRCQSCGRESPLGAAFCLNCGTRLVASPSPTPGPAGGLPAQVACGVCGGPNQPGMNFCRHCGNPMHGAAVPPNARAALSHAPTPVAPPPGPPPAFPAPTNPTPPGMGRDPQICRRCGGHTAIGFSFCQQCGAPLDVRAGVAATLAASPEVVAAIRAGSPLGGPVGQVPMGVSAGMAAPVGPPPPAPPLAPPAAPPHAAPGPAPIGNRPTPFGGHGGTPPPELLARARSSPIQATTPGAGVPVSGPHRAGDRGAAWGSLISVRRDGSDGDRFALTGEWLEIGREADLAFDDRYLAARHARLEKSGNGVRVVSLDTLNGVFRKVRGVELVASGTTLLLGRELLRLELVDEEEREVVPLIRHGVAMFGSPPRKPWARLIQLLSNGGTRDVRNLHTPEVIVGREEGELVFRDDEFLSRRHAALRWNGSVCTLEDLKSSNGSFARLRGATVLAAGDVLRMGDQMFRFEPGA